jgi:1-acyl-sn-glycerol-3-phosphate acyltransferase
MIRAIFYQISFWFYLLSIILEQRQVARTYRSGKVQEARQRATLRAQDWGAFCIRRTGSKVNVHGQVKLAEGEGALFVGNHQGAFDIPLLLAFMGHPIGFIAKIQLRKMPFVGAWMTYIGCHFLDRDDKRQAVTMMKEATIALQAGDCVVIYPEGTRSNSHEMAPFKKGSVSLAIRAGVPVIPFTINHTWKMRDKKRGGIHPTQIELFIGDPIPTKDLSKEEKDKLTELVREKIAMNLLTPDGQRQFPELSAE